jgi:hypothetical protein
MLGRDRLEKMESIGVVWDHNTNTRWIRLVKRVSITSFIESSIKGQMRIIDGQIYKQSLQEYPWPPISEGENARVQDVHQSGRT